jgi:dTDP-4-amino-4,6-dideoxygalactose transaminase
MAVPLLDIGRQHAPIMAELKGVLDRALESSRFIKGPEMEALEAEFAAYSQTRFAVGCASGTDALILSLMALGLGTGDLVLTTPFTFFASAGAVVRAGGLPAFVDILPDTFNMDPGKLREWMEAHCALTERGAVERETGRKVAAVMPVHLFGQVADMDAIGSVCREWGVPVVEDACQSVGARWNALRAGSIGRMGGFSFFPSKNLGALGDAGMVTTDDGDLAERVVRLREHGGQGYIHREIGFNSRLDSLQAGFLRVKLSHLDRWHEGRRRNAAFYDDAFRGLEQVETPFIDPRAWSVYNQYTIRAADRDGLMTHLRGKGIGCAVYYPLPLHLQECFAPLGHAVGDFPASESAAGAVLSLPVFGELTEGELAEVASAVRTFYGRG